MPGDLGMEYRFPTEGIFICYTGCKGCANPGDLAEIVGEDESLPCPKCCDDQAETKEEVLSWYVLDMAIEDHVEFEGWLLDLDSPLGFQEGLRILARRLGLDPDINPPLLRKCGIGWVLKGDSSPTFEFLWKSSSSDTLEDRKLALAQMLAAQAR